MVRKGESVVAGLASSGCKKGGWQEGKRRRETKSEDEESRTVDEEPALHGSGLVRRD